MVIFHHDQLQSMFLWSTGTLTQTDWSVAQRLWPQLLGGQYSPCCCCGR